MRLTGSRKDRFRSSFSNESSHSINWLFLYFSGEIHQNDSETNPNGSKPYCEVVLSINRPLHPVVNPECEHFTCEGCTVENCNSTCLIS